MYLDVLVEIKNKMVDQTFTYFVPDKFRPICEVGKRVLVPFGNRQLEGYIIGIKKESLISEIKSIINVIDEEPVLNEEMLALGHVMSEKTFSSLSSCYAAMLPKALKAKKGSNVSKKFLKYLRLTKSKEELLSVVTKSPQKDIILLFPEGESILRSKANQVSISAVKTLIRHGYVEETEFEVYRYQSSILKSPKMTLTEEQQIAFEAIQKGFNQSITYLLHGVTGSGKTEIYLQLIEEVLRQNKTALVLVPEISLTPQLVGRFAARFLNKIAVLHSGLSDGERYDEWRKIIKEEASIVIGARSAVFAPIKNIGIIIMDEEHSESYIQDVNPRYHALDMAQIRSKTYQCPLVLGSATPSLSSMARALKKVYTYVPLMKRVNGGVLPPCTIVDMSDEVKNKHPYISRELECKMIEKLNAHEQVLLLLNRRGYSTTITCSNCGYTYRCPHCDITLTYHKASHNLRCHYCGYTKYLDQVCPKCGEDALNYYGMGTEKLESMVNEYFPTARVIRMDADVTTKKGMYEKITQDFYNHQYDILIGTQMISKGLDFPDVSLVGIINADASLNIPDYRSNERTFSLLYQASGRAGRKKTSGEVILQTFYPTNYILNCVKENNYQKFYQYEMNIRHTLKYPPFYFLACLTFKSKNYELASKEAKKCKEYLTRHLNKTSVILGPTSANMFLIRGIYHFELLIKYRFDEQLIPSLYELDKIYKINRNIEMDIDFQ